MGKINSFNSTIIGSQRNKVCYIITNKRCQNKLQRFTIPNKKCYTLINSLLICFNFSLYMVYTYILKSSVFIISNRFQI